MLETANAHGEGIVWKYHISLFLLVWRFILQNVSLKHTQQFLSQKEGRVCSVLATKMGFFSPQKKEAEPLLVPPTVVMGMDRLHTLI